MTKSNSDNPKPPEQVNLTGSITIEAAAAPADGQAVRNRRFTMVAYTGGPMRVAGFSYPVVVDLGGLDMSKASFPIFVGHKQDIDDLLGQTDRVEVVGSNLVASGEVIGTSPRVQRVVEAHDKGFKWQSSIGAAVGQREFVPEGHSVNVNGSSFQGPVIVARRAELGEISFVFVGADRNTSASIAANAAKENQNMDEVTTTTIEGTEGKPAGTAVEAKPAADGGSTAIAAAAVVATPDPVAEMRARAAAEQERIVAVQKVCGDDHAEICAKAIKDGWDVTRTELEVLRAERPKPPSVHVHDNTITGNVLEAAAMLTANLHDVEKLHDAKTLDLAARIFSGGITLQELLLEAAWANGYTGKSFRDTRAILRFAFARDIQASGLSTVDIGGILSNVANKFLLEGFFGVERVWASIATRKNVSDFKQVTSFRLTGAEQYEHVAPGGKLKHGTLGNESYTNKADTFGLMLSVDRRDIINDDLGAITTIPRKLGRGSGLKINDVFWTIFLANSAFFTADRKNYLAGATTGLGIDSLSGAEQTFMDQVDSEGKPTGIMPSILLVPTGLSTMATQLYKALEIRDNTAGKGAYTTNNPHSSKYRVEVSRYLANAKFEGYSAKAWYLLADPSDLPVIEVAFLNGQESPTIETAAADFDTLGVQMRAYHDFGVALQDFRGGCKVKGEA